MDSYENTNQQKQQDQFNDLAFQTRYHMNLSKNIQKPQIQMTTQYKTLYKKHHLHPKKVNKKVPKLQRQEFLGQFKTTYQNSFLRTNNEKNHKQSAPENLIKTTEVPFTSLTTYKQCFPGHSGQNQYVKIKNQRINNFTKSDFRTTYSTKFNRVKLKSQGKVQPSPSKTFFHSKYDDKIFASTCKSSYSIEFRENTKNRRNNSIDLETRKNPQKQPKYDYYSSNLFATPIKKSNKEITKKPSFTPPTNSSFNQKYNFKKYEQKQLQNLRQKMKTCYY